MALAISWEVVFDLKGQAWMALAISWEVVFSLKGKA